MVHAVHPSPGLYIYTKRKGEGNGKGTEPASKLDLPQDRTSVFCPGSTVATVSRGTQASLERETQRKVTSRTSVYECLVRIFRYSDVKVTGLRHS